MYARVISYHARPQITTDDATAMYRQIISVLERVEGFLGSVFLMNESTHRAVSITWWRDGACAAEGGRKSLPLLMQIGDLVETPPEIAGYDVIDHYPGGLGLPPDLSPDYTGVTP